MNDVNKQLTRSALAIVISAIIVSGCAQESKDSAKQSQPASKIQSASKTDSSAQARPELSEVAGLVMASEPQADAYQGSKEVHRSAKVMAASMAQRIVSPQHVSASDRSLLLAPNANDKFESLVQNGNMVAGETPVSTFSIDVDTGSYSTTRRLINQGQLPVKNTVRVEELVNYFSYDYPVPTTTEQPFSVNTELAPSPYNADTQLLRIGIKGFDVAADQLGASNLVLLLDVSGSMSSADKLPLLKQAMLMLSQQLSAQDKVSIVVYAGASGVVLDGVAGNDFTAIKTALSQLTAQGGTNGSQGIQLAYQLAQKHFIENGSNRVILATDGDFNLGMTDHQQLVDFVTSQSKSGIGLSTLAFGLGSATASYNDHLLEQLSNKANGQYAFIDTLNEARKVLVDQLSATLLTIAHDVKVQIEFNPAVVSEYRLIGYENRLLNRSDFNNDAIDAGEIGAGHTVTALYEIRYNDSQNRLVDPLRYAVTESTQIDEAKVHQHIANEVAYLKLRYKASGEQNSQLIAYPISRDQQLTHLHQASDDFRFAAAVAGFGQLLNHNNYVHDTDYAKLIVLAQSAMGQDRFGYRHEFVQMLKTASVLERQLMITEPDTRSVSQ
ncbi:vWA domain-containing protein [Shewanella psychromarinicola]|uniref:VWA domain-containing protein n=1 Tax=Shewanella psychromarinicola TaxID=2487742 RepID=A0A3N4F1R8_9GAMM|nr:VWA domain-containing protein [Shewanella psychromarinicola]AZG37099.1 VWA domain-containing protein [Shewanella psychromarinicola]MCL1083004.1 VWA domain-containing protein [Shewanella psychromarinicola]RPA34954.1 VWA domain-containing protein [Shewanella psychromarinicola]